MHSFRSKLKDTTCSSVLKFVFWCLGVSVNSNEGFIYSGYSYIMITAAFLYPWTNVHLLFHNLDNFDVVANAMFNVGGGFVAFGKLLIMLFNRNRLKHIFEELEKIKIKHNKEEWSKEEVYYINMKISILLTLYYTVLVCLYGLALIERLVNEDPGKWRMPISDFSVVNITYSPNYEIAWTYQVLGASVASSAYCITDLLIASITVDLCIQFKILRSDIQKIFNGSSTNKDPTTREDINWISFRPTIKKIVDRHLFLIDLITEVQKFTSPMLFLSVAGNLGVGCFPVYYASVLPPLDPKVIQSYFEIVAIICGLFLICYYGTEISHANESIASACYEINFIGTDTTFQKSLMMIIIRSQKPIALTVGGFVDLSLPVFVSILRTTYTYFMVLSKTSGGNINVP